MIWLDLDVEPPPDTGTPSVEAHWGAVICMYYTNSARVCVKSLRSAKSRHSKDSKLVRQVHIIEKILSETMSEQKNFFCENAIFVKNYWHKKVHFDM